MDKQSLIEKINSVKDVSKDRNIIYSVLDELNISYKKTNCKKCLNDLMNIAKEELELIGSAADESSFNDGDFEYVYICDRPQSWRGYIINQDTPVEVIREFIKSHKGYYKINKQNKDNDMNIPNFIAKPNAVHTVVADAGVQPVPAGITVPEENNDDNENNDQEINQ